uniref:Translation initiation factor eIF-2B subunit epsilon-like n=1 Tax=Saccoglossus kowalevskii TaxID=10224 RepID=A0ABM0M9J8_SACKO|nr:PREDICTED: translation initiation factor eIF-2B subunit epsilon-like [Saccoglossus kowalevskii]
MSKKKKAATETLLKQDDILQAVVLADSFNVRFAPITLEKPRIMGNQIHLHLLHTEYAARVSNLYMYDAISKDVIHRWTYPFVVDNNLCVNESGYMLLRHNIYISKDITLARGCVLKEDVVVGQGTCIGTNTVISNSVIGRNCQIGENVILKNAYIWDNVVICGHCEIDSSLICNGSTVLSNVTIQPNCTISYNVTVGPDVNIKPGTLLTTQLPTLNTGFDDLSDSKWLTDLCVDTEQDEESSEDESIEDLTPPTTPPLDDTRMFYNEVLDSLHRGIEENINCDNLVLEINSSKYAYNVSMKELNGLVVKAILELPQLQSTLRPPQYLSALKTLLKQLSPVLQNYIKSCESQMDCLVALEEYCGSCENFAPIIMQVIHYMYDQMEILQESVILSWYNQTSSSDEPHTRMKHQEIRKQVTTFVKWLEEADEESDSDDDDDDSN